jgi:dTDP-4-amino-4,6-dideoxygalactose transaminase
MAVPLLDVAAQNGPLEPELQAAFLRVLKSGRYILGPEVHAFEEEMAADCGVPHAIGVSSGTDALLLALMSLGIGPGDEVLCPSFTFFATAGSIARTGATPVFVDSREETFNIDVADAATKITPRTRAIIPVHLFGCAADMDAVNALAKSHALKVIEDAAQSQGARWQDKPVGSFSDCATFSFYPTKNLGALGDAGMFVTAHDDLAQRARLLRNHGAEPKYHHEAIGGNFRLDELQAAFLRVKRTQLKGWIDRRAANAAQYRKQLENVPGLILPQEADGHTWNQFTLRLENQKRRDAIAARLREAGIGHEIYYPEALHVQPCFAAHNPSPCPVAAQLSDQVLSLPIYPELHPAQIEEVCSQIESFARA